MHIKTFNFSNFYPVKQSPLPHVLMKSNLQVDTLYFSGRNKKPIAIEQVLEDPLYSKILSLYREQFQDTNDDAATVCRKIVFQLREEMFWEGNIVSPRVAACLYDATGKEPFLNAAHDKVIPEDLIAAIALLINQHGIKLLEVLDTLETSKIDGVEKMDFHDAELLRLRITSVFVRRKKAGVGLEDFEKNKAANALVKQVLKLREQSIPEREKALAIFKNVVYVLFHEFPGSHFTAAGVRDLLKRSNCPGVEYVDFTSDALRRSIDNTSRRKEPPYRTTAEKEQAMAIAENLFNRHKTKAGINPESK